MRLERLVDVPSINIVLPASCVGCGGCEIVCPMNCIAMREDSEGFLAPFVDDGQCIGCSKCLNVCPTHNQPELISPKYAVIFRSLEPETKDSSSGGAAYALGSVVLERGGVVVACALDENGVARHFVIEDAFYRGRSQGSKYIQSDARKGFEACKRFLAEGREVLFIGTPCQVAAVRNICRNERGLITCDLVCHGVPSPGFWRQALEYQNSRGLLTDKSAVMFRSSDHRSRANYELYCKKSKGKRIPYESDAYFSLFMKNASLRESCYHCFFAQENRVGDLTIGDCASRDYYADFYPCRSVSSVFVNTSKGEELFKSLSRFGKVDFKKIDFATEVQLNKQLHTPSVRPNIRDSVYVDLSSMDYGSFSEKYQLPLTLGLRVKRLLKLLIPVSMRNFFRKLMKRNARYGE